MAVAEKYEIESELIPAIATGFCGGNSRTAGPCGALSGGIMAIGILFGRKSPEDSHIKSYALTERLVRDFKKHFGSTNCSDLLGCDISTKEGAVVFQKNNLGKTVCRDVTVKAADLLMKVLENHDKIRHSVVE